MIPAVAEARRIIAARSKSFALASRLLSPEESAAAAVVYGYCRRVDDAVDGAPRAAQADAITRLLAELDALYGAGKLDGDPILAGFSALIKAHRIPRLYPEELIAGMAMDARDFRYQTWDDLILYCYRVAGTVGLMMCHVFGLADDRALENAAHMGIAMQLTNICRDVAEDWSLGRLYLPQVLLEQHGLGALRAHLGEPFPAWARAPMRDAVKATLKAAETYYRSGDAGLAFLPWRSALAVRAARNVYAAIGDRIAARGFDVIAGRAFVSGRRKAGLCARAGVDAVAEARTRLRRRVRFRAPQATLTFSPSLMIQGAAA